MATEYLYLEGKVKWCKAFKPDEEYRNYTVDFYPDNPDAFAEAGIGLQAKTDEDGTFFRVKRPIDKVINGELVNFGPPKVFINTGQVDDKGIPIAEPFNKLIGNGSRATLKISVFPAGKFVGHRWESIRVDEHVPYEKTETPKEATAEYPF